MPRARTRNPARAPPEEAGNGVRGGHPACLPGTAPGPASARTVSASDQRLYQRHLWRSEGFHGKAKTCHGLGCAVRRGLDNMKIQAYLTAAAINL